MVATSRWLRRPSLVGFGVLVAAMATTLVVRARGPRVPVAIAARHDLEQHLVASGRVMPPARIEIASLSTGRVASVAVREGDRVKAGDVLVALDDAEARAAVLSAQAAVAQARARAEQIRTVASVVSGRASEQARANLGRAEQELDRVTALVRAGALPQKDLDDAQRAHDVARAQRDAAEAQEIGSSARGVDARAALAAISQAEAQLATAKVRLADTRISALADAIVLSRDVEPSMVVQPARTLLVLAALGDTRLVVQPDERDLAFVRPGQKARASADAFPDEVFDAEVSFVAPSVEAQRGTVEVRLRVPSPPDFLRPDMTVSVDVAVAKKEGALVVPFEAVRGLATPRPWALVVASGRAERRDVRVGMRGEGAVEIAAGLGEGDEVVLPDGQSVAPGQRVRAYARGP